MQKKYVTMKAVDGVRNEVGIGWMRGWMDGWMNGWN